MDGEIFLLDARTGEHEIEIILHFADGLLPFLRQEIHLVHGNASHVSKLAAAAAAAKVIDVGAHGPVAPETASAVVQGRRNKERTRGVQGESYSGSTTFVHVSYRNL